MRTLESFTQVLPGDVVRVQYRVVVPEGVLSVTRELSNNALVAEAAKTKKTTWDESDICAMLTVAVGATVALPELPVEGA